MVHGAKIEIDMSELSAVPGIDTDKVARYGMRILKYAKDAKRRLVELKQQLKDAANDADGVVPDPNHHPVISLPDSDDNDDNDNKDNNDGSDEEYGGDFMDQASSLLNLDERNVVSSRYFPSQPPTAQDSSDEFHDAVSEQTGRKSRRRQASKRPRRKTPSGSGFKGKGSRTKPKSSDGTGNRSSSSRKVSKAKPSAPRIPMMPT